jgi:signal transduction histidine kinase
MEKFRQPYFRYLVLISLLGIVPVIGGIAQLPSYTQKINFILLVLLGIVAQNASTSVSVENRTSITYAIGSAISIAVVPVFGPFAAALIEVVAAFSLWLLKPKDKTKWKRSWQQLGFNAGMSSLAIFVAGWGLLFFRNWFGIGTILGETLPWLIAALLNDQINLWLLIGILYLQNPEEFSPQSFWKENSWASQVAILVVAFGGGILAFSIRSYDWIGIAVFFMPIVLSAYAFRLYVNQMKEHMNNLENIVAERTQELANLMKEKDQFLAVLTHDMKSPLTSIGIYAGLIKDRPQLMIERPDMAGVIMRSQETLTDMVNNILDLEKLQADGNLPLDKETIDLASLIDVTVEPLMAQASEKEILLAVKIDPVPLIAELDRSQFKRVIQNLVSNAIKYTPKNGHVWINVATNDQRIIINIQDDGYGIPAEELPYVFDRYRRVAKHKNVAAGTGLGLAITQAIVEAHEGHISVISEEEKGSTFTIELPL